MLKASIVFCLISVGLPLILSLFAEVEFEADTNKWIVSGVGLLGLLTLMHAARGFSRELNFYSNNSLDADSRVELNVIVKNHASGKWRMFFYYPFTFFGSSVAIGAVVLFFRQST